MGLAVQHMGRMSVFCARDLDSIPRRGSEFDVLTPHLCTELPELNVNQISSRIALSGQLLPIYNRAFDIIQNRWMFSDWLSQLPAENPNFKLDWLTYNSSSN